MESTLRARAPQSGDREAMDDRVQALVANIPDVVWTTDSAGKTTYISPNVERVYGYTPDEIYQAGKELWLERIHPDDVASVREAYESLFGRNEMFDVEYRIQRKDGRWIWLHDRAVATYEKGGMTYTDGVFADITARVQAERQRDLVQKALQEEQDAVAATLLRHAEQLRLIGDVGRRITSILDIDDLLIEIARLVKEALGYYLVGIALIEGDEVVFKEGAGGVWETPGFRPPRLKVGQEGITGWVAQRGEPLLVPDVSADPRYYALPQASEVRSEIAVPLKAQDAVVGVLHAQSDRPGAFDETDLDILQSLAHQAAIAIQNARSYASARQELVARERAEAALQRMNQELEQRVEERTAELARANASLRAEIAERVRAEDALQESEIRYRTLFQSANDAIFVMRGDRFLECNRAAEALFGCSGDDIVGSSPLQFSPPRQPDGSDSREQAMTKIDAALEGRPQFFEWAHCRMDGTLFDAEVSLNRLSLGDEWLVLAMVRDITERKRAEAQLLTEKEFTDMALDAQMDTFFLFEPATGKALRWNRAFRDISGYTDEEIARIPAPASYYSPNDLERAAAFVQKVLVEGAGTIELELVCVDGRRVPTEYRVSVISDDQGEPKYIISIGRDVAERKRAEEALRESEERLSSFMDSASDSFYLLDSDLNFVEINRKGLEIIGKSKEEVVGKNITDIVPDVRESGRYEKHLEVMRTGQPFAIDHFVPHPVFGDMHFILESFRVGNGLGVIASDITERVHAEKALRRYADRLEILHEIDRGILAARSPEAIAQVAVGCVRRLVPCRRAGITLFDFATNEAIVLAVDVEAESGLEKGTRIPLDRFEDLIKAAQHGQVVTWEGLRS